MPAVLGRLLAEAVTKLKSLSRGHLQPTPQAKSLPWPETPFQLISDTGARKRFDIPEGHYCVRNAQIMAQTHNTIFRALNAIYHQARKVVPGTKDVEDLLFFCRVACDFIHCHHTAEEAAYFPGIEEEADLPGLMECNVEQHRCLEEGLERFRRYASDTTKYGYNAEELRHVIDELAGPLGSHMHEEIPTILDLHWKVPSSTLEKIYSKMHHAAANTMDNWKAGPFVFGCQDAEFLLDGKKIAFPEVPVPFVVPYIIDQVVARRYSGAWRFCPSSAYGRPRPYTGRPTAPGLFKVVGGLRVPIIWLMVLLLAYSVNLSAYVYTGP